MKMSPNVNSKFVEASLAEFISVWRVGGEASLSLTTRGGNINMSFNLSLGHPGASFLPSSPTSSSSKPRHRGPAEKERSRQRAALHQASKVPAQVPAQVPALGPAPVPAPAPEHVSAPVPTPGPAQVSSAESQATSPVMASVIAPVTSPVVFTSIPSPKSSFATIASVNLNAAPAFSPVIPTPAYVTGMEFSSGRQNCPGNVPPPPLCKKCGKFTTWEGSRVKRDLAWLHFYMCSGSSLIDGFPSYNIQTCLITPPLS